jgi:hypothetical protein
MLCFDKLINFLGSYDNKQTKLRVVIQPMIHPAFALVGQFSRNYVSYPFIFV